MDRQALLEQKRQRLQELKKRRENFRNDVPATSAISTSLKVDFAVQVDLLRPPEIGIQHSVASSTISSVTRFEKGVQTDFVELQVEKNPEIHPQEQYSSLQTVQPPVPEYTVESTLEEQLARSSLETKFSGLRLGIRKHESSQLDSKEPFTVNQTISLIDRPVTHLCTCTEFPELILVGYGPKSSTETPIPDLVTESAGLAVVFNRNALVPEFFLQCTSTITSLKFSLDPFRIIAGLENGRVVVWDLSDVQPTQIAILPTLQSTTLASAGQHSEKSYIHHTSPVVFIQHLDSGLGSGIVSVSAEGVLNVWSPNFLAFPKLDSVRLAPSDRLRDQIRATDVALLFHGLNVDEKHARTPEFRFLNHMVVGLASGKIYRLFNGKDKQYVSKTLPASGQVTCVIEMVVSPTLSILLSAHSDWQLRVWDMAKTEPLATIPTSTVVSRICMRPGHPFQMIMLGGVNPPKVASCIQFWDLHTRLMAPVSTISTEKYATSVSFALDGSHVIIGFDDGDITVWDIDETQFHETNNIDEGLLPLLQGL